MRFVSVAATSLLTSALLVVAACTKAEAPKAAPTAPTAAEMGQDEPGAPFSPPAPGAAHTYEAMSKTAMSITGNLTITPTAQTGPNMPPGATFTFSKGMAVTATLMPGAATQGTPLFDFKTVFAGARPIDADKIEMYSVETEKPAAPGRSGSICEKTSLLATYLDDAGTPATADDVLTIAAFSSDDWPPSKPGEALCATYSYTPATR